MQKISKLALIPLMNNNSWDVPDILFYSRCAAEKCFYLSILVVVVVVDAIHVIDIDIGTKHSLVALNVPSF